MNPLNAPSSRSRIFSGAFLLHSFHSNQHFQSIASMLQSQHFRKHICLTYIYLFLVLFFPFSPRNPQPSGRSSLVDTMVIILDFIWVLCKHQVEFRWFVITSDSYNVFILPYDHILSYQVHRLSIPRFFI